MAQLDVLYVQLVVTCTIILKQADNKNMEITMTSPITRQLTAGISAFIAFSVMFITGCNPAAPSIQFSPPPGVYAGPIELNMTVINLNPIGLNANIIYTTDGTTPDLDYCDEPFSGPLTIPSSVEISAAFTTDGFMLEGFTTATYTIGSGGGGNEDDPARDAMEDWITYETLITNWFFCEFNGCATPGTDNVLFCPAGDPKCLPWTINQYDSNGVIIGTAYFDAREFNATTFEAKTEIVLTNFRINHDGAVMRALSTTGGVTSLLQEFRAPASDPSAYPGSLYVSTGYDLTATGALIGNFNLDFEGYNRTPTPLALSTIAADATYTTATVDDFTNVTPTGPGGAAVKSSGSYKISCGGGEGCGPLNTYLAPNWEKFVVADIPDSCTASFHMMVSRDRPEFCLISGTDGRIEPATCNPGNNSHQWNILLDSPVYTDVDSNGDGTVDSTTSTPTYKIQSTAADNCLQYVSAPLDDHFEATACASGLETQRFLVSGSGFANFMQLANRIDGYPRCMAITGNTGFEKVIATNICNATFKDQQWGFLENGTVPSKNPREYVSE